MVQSLRTKMVSSTMEQIALVRQTIVKTEVFANQDTQTKDIVAYVLLVSHLINAKKMSTSVHLENITVALKQCVPIPRVHITAPARKVILETDGIVQMSTSVQRTRTTVAVKQTVPISKAPIIAHAKRDFLEMDENVHEQSPASTSGI